MYPNGDPVQCTIVASEVLHVQDIGRNASYWSWAHEREEGIGPRVWISGKKFKFVRIEGYVND